MATQPISFDAPLQQAQTLSVPGAPAAPIDASNLAPSGVSFDAPTTQPTTITVSGQQPSTQQTGAQTTAPQNAAQSFKPVASFSAVPNATTADHIRNWANSVSGDLRYGTTTTTLGTLLHKMGAQPLENGVSPSVADFMGSLPLGLLQATRGGAELTEDGHRFQGKKDLVSGALDASSIPGSFVAPEGAELASSGIDAGMEQANRAAKAAGEYASNTLAGRAVKAVGRNVSNTFDPKSIQVPLQQGIRSVLDTVAKEAGVSPSTATSIRDVASDLSTAVRAKASGIYKQLDAATGGGRFQRFQDALSNIEQGLRESIGVDPEKYENLVTRKAEVEQAQKAALDTAKAAGVDPSLISKANAAWRQHAALSDVANSIRQSVSGLRPEIANGAKASPESVNAKTLFSKMNRLYDKGRLADAIGPDNAASLLQHIDSAYLLSQKIANRNKYAGAAAKAIGLGGAGGLGYELVKGAHDLLSSGQ